MRAAAIACTLAARRDELFVPFDVERERATASRRGAQGRAPVSARDASAEGPRAPDPAPGLAPGTVAVSAVVFLGGIGGGIAFPIIPMLGVQLGIPAFFVGWILSANRITRLFTNPVTGALIDRFGGKWPLTVGLLVEAVATALYSVALFTSIPGWLLLIGRAIWGVGSSAILVGGVTLALNASSPANRGRTTAVVRLAQRLGVPAGLLAGGLVAGLISDNAAFLFATAITLVASALAWLFIPSAHGAAAPPHRTAERAPARRRLAAAIRSVWRADRRVQVVWIANAVVTFSIQGALLATLVLLVHDRGFRVAGLGEEPMAGTLMAVMMFASAIVMVYVGRALDRISSRTVLALPGVVAAAGGFVVLALTGTVWLTLLAVILLGVGLGSASVPLITLLGDLTPPDRRGQVVGTYQLFGDIGGSLGPVVGLALAVDVGFVATYLGCAVLVLLLLPLLTWLRGAEPEAR